MFIKSKLRLLMSVMALASQPVLADEQQQSSQQNQVGQSSSTSSSSETVGPDGTVTRRSSYRSSSSSSTSTKNSANQAPGSAGGTSSIIESNENGVIRKFVPKFKQRLVDLADQIKMAQGKGFLTADEVSKFMERQSKLLMQEEAASKKGFPRSELDALEREITLLNGDVFKAMRKSDPVKPGQAEKEVNDPNLIPAYPDPELQPGSGKP